MTTTKTTGHRLKKKLTTTLTLTAATTALLTSCYPNPAIFLGANEENTKLNGSTAISICGNGALSSGGLVATGTYASLTEEQNRNAQLILGAVQERPGIEEKDRERLGIITLITAIQESSLINVNYGDDIHGVRNPDGSLTSSLGLFQQQHWWGTEEQRMDPKTSANLFMDALMQVSWTSLEYGAAAQAVQRSAHPGLYSNHIQFAKDIIANIGGSFTDAGSGDSGNSEENNSESKSSTPGCNAGKGTGEGGAGDDYPLAADAASIASGFDPDLDPWGMYVGQCVSYVSWRLNKQMGWKEGEPYPFTAAKMQMAGQANGYEWSGQLAEMGYLTDKNPKKGAVAWWDSYANEYVGEYGHVAIVESYDLEAGTVTVSQYNMQPKPLQYSEYTFPIDKISGFIHVADLE